MRVNIIINDVEISDKYPDQPEFEVSKALSVIVYELSGEGRELKDMPNIEIVSGGSNYISGKQFMEAFRHSATLNQEMSDDDCREVFLSILKGDGDITHELLSDLFNNYCLNDDDVDFIFRAKVNQLESFPVVKTAERPNRNPKPCSKCEAEITEPYPHEFLGLPYCDECAYNCVDCECTYVGEPRNSEGRCGWCQLIADAVAVVEETREEQGKI
jgi:hypothetical protein